MPTRRQCVICSIDKFKKEANESLSQGRRKYYLKLADMNLDRLKRSVQWSEAQIINRLGLCSDVHIGEVLAIIQYERTEYSDIATQKYLLVKEAEEQLNHWKMQLATAEIEWIKYPLDKTKEEAVNIARSNIHKFGRMLTQRKRRFEEIKELA